MWPRQDLATPEKKFERDRRKRVKGKALRLLISNILEEKKGRVKKKKKQPLRNG